MDSLKHKATDISPISHPIRGLLIAQFFGSFDDNAWKLMVVLEDAVFANIPGWAMNGCSDP